MLHVRILRSVKRRCTGLCFQPFSSNNSNMFSNREFLENNKDLLKSPNNFHNVPLFNVVESLNKDGCDEPFPKPYFPLGAKNIILRYLDLYAINLNAGKFKSESGAACRLVVGGEKGIGKTIALKSGLCALAVKFPNMYTQYIEYVPGTMNSLGPVMAEAMGMENSNEKTIDDCLSALRIEKKCFFLVLDEIDMMYTSRDEFKAKMQVLNELMMLGSQTGGRICVFICGNASVTTSLISRGALGDPEMQRKYPMLSDAPDLNYTKWTAIYPFKHSTSKEDMVQIAIANGFPEKIAQDVSGPLYFFCGGNARQCTMHCKMLLSDQEVSAGGSAHLTDMTSKVQPMLSQKDLDLYNHLMTALVERNESLMATDLWNADWFSLMPLARYEVEDILRSTSSHGMAILHLADLRLFSISHQDAISYLYPSSPLLLYRERAAAVMRNHEKEHGNTTAATINELEKAGAEAMEEELSKMVKRIKDTTKM